jgi:hypothetical protein
VTAVETAGREADVEKVEEEEEGSGMAPLAVLQIEAGQATVTVVV